MFQSIISRPNRIDHTLTPPSPSLTPTSFPLRPLHHLLLTDNKKTLTRQWVEESDSSDSDRGRKVISAKDKAWEKFKMKVQSIRQGMGIKDWNKVQTNFDELGRDFAKQKSLVAEHGGLPKFYLKLLMDLETLLLSLKKEKASQGKMSKTNVKSYNKMQLNFRKYLKSSELEGKLEEYKKNPVDSDKEASDSSDSESTDSESDSSSSSDSEAPTAKKKSAPVVKAKGSDSDSDSDSDNDDDSSDWGSVSSDSSSSDEDEEDDKFAGLKGRAKWLKTSTVVKVKEVKDKTARSNARKEEKEKVRN